MREESHIEQKKPSTNFDLLRYHLEKGEVPTGEAFKLAIDIIEIFIKDNSDQEMVNLFTGTSVKIKGGQPLGDYESSVIIDIINNVDYDQKKKERKARGTRFGHITRRIIRNEPLKGKTLELALELVDVNGDDEFSNSLKSICNKLKAGQPLSEYEIHIMVDMVLPHARLG